MYLKAIELENFKSFGRRTRLEFKEGFTAISGPNGSGKSNITDAILFVLGPKSSKKIRAQRLTDLIYNGGKNGRPADYCRVSLIFDNKDRVLPIDEDEVKLTRYIKRASNEEGYNSYFYVNDERARLQDFNSILMHAKISADGYNFVQQGDVTNIVEMTPMERRVILDDIAGITKFDSEIKKAEDKRRITEENMGRIEVRLDEIRRNLEKLEKDRQLALRYRELEEKLQETNAKIAFSRMKEAEGAIESYTRQLKNIEKSIIKLKEEIKERGGEVETLEKKVAEIDEKIKAMGMEEISRMSKKIEDLKIKYAEAKMDRENKEDRVSEVEAEIDELNENLKEIGEDIKSRYEELKELKKRKEEIKGNYDEKLRELRSKEQSLGTANKKFRELQIRVGDLQKEIKSLRESYSSKIEEENKIRGEISRIRGEIASKEENIKDVEAAISDAEWRISQFKNESRGFEKEKKALEKEYYDLNSKESKLSKELKEKEKLVTQLAAEYEKIKARMEGSEGSLSRAVMAILGARDRGELKGIYGTIAELGNVDDKYALAIEIAAGSRMMSIVCEDDDAAARAIEYLKRNRLGRAIFLPLNKMLRGRPRGKAILAARDSHTFGFAMDLIKFDKKFEAAFWYVFGDTVIVDNLDNARRLMGGVRLVTLDGQLIEASGAMVGGSVEKRRQISMGNLEEIGRRLRKATEEKEIIQAELDKVRSELDEVIRKIREIKTQDNTSQIAIWEEERRRNRDKLKILREQVKKLEDEMDNYEKLLESVDSEASEIKRRIEELEHEEMRLREEMERLIPENISMEISALRAEVEELSSQLQDVEKNIVRTEGEIKILKEKNMDLENEIQKKSELVERLIKEMKDLSNRMDEITIERRKLEEILEKERSKIQGLMDERDELVSKIEKVKEEITKKKRDVEVNENLKVHVLSNLNAQKTSYEEAKREYESYGIEVEKPESITRLKNMLRDIQSQMVSMGPVNMRSIDEYNEERERYDELNEEYNKLKEEKRNLQRLVNELNGKKKDGLMKVFNAINENFKKIYHEVSNGGDAELLLENPEDPFKGGLIIRVKPVGKKFLRLESLSGGEKSLTALAFIFAIQQYDPSPFYVLDEVDMFLDGVNAEMVGRIIKRNSKTAQFIVISLRKATLKFADYVIGVTHRGDGLSRVFIQKVPEVEEGAA